MKNLRNSICENTIDLDGTVIHRHNISSITYKYQPEPINNYCVHIRVIYPIINGDLFIEFFCEYKNECLEYTAWFDTTPTITVRQPRIPGKCQ